jgi:hypothetical protein
MISGLKFDAKILNRPKVTIINFLEIVMPAHRSLGGGGRPGPRGAGPPRYPLQVLARSSLWAFRSYRWPMPVRSSFSNSNFLYGIKSVISMSHCLNGYS